MTDRLAKCTDLSELPDPAAQTFRDILIITGLVGGVTAGIKFTGLLAGLGAELAGILAGVLIGVVLLTALYRAVQRLCPPEPDGLADQCVSGVVSEIVPSFNDVSDKLFPVMASHDRIDLVTKSAYWDLVEYSNAEVFCTDNDDLRRRSEILRCYFFDPSVCEAARRAWEGAAVGAVIGLVLGTIVAVLLCAIGFCLLGLFLAGLISATLTLAGAAIGAAIARWLTDDAVPSDAEGQPIVIGDFLSARGNLLQSEVDGGANVLWWVSEAVLCGQCPSSIPNDPYSHCDIDEEFLFDVCDSRPVVQ